MAVIVMGLVIILFLLGIFITGYLKGRRTMMDELDEMSVYVESVEAANRLTLTAWQTATAMTDIANGSPRQGFPPTP